MAPFLLLAGAIAVVAGSAMLSTAVAIIVAGVILMLAACGIAAIQDRKAPR